MLAQTALNGSDPCQVMPPSLFLGQPPGKTDLAERVLRIWDIHAQYVVCEWPSDQIVLNAPRQCGDASRLKNRAINVNHGGNHLMCVAALSTAYASDLSSSVAYFEPDTTHG